MGIHRHRGGGGGAAAAVLLLVFCLAPPGYAADAALYCVKESSTEQTWDWEIPGDCSGTCGPVTSGAPALQVASQFVACINAACTPPTGRSQSADLRGGASDAALNCTDGTWEALFSVARDESGTDAGFTLIINDSSTMPNCDTSSTVCNFNPKITLAPTVAVAPGMSIGGAVALAALLLVAASVLLFRRFRVEAGGGA